MNFGYSGFNDNSFFGYYINDYSEVLSSPVPSNGQAVIFANLNAGKMYSKKMINGMSYIQEYNITPVNSTSDDLFKKIEELENKINSLQSSNTEVKKEGK